MKLINSIPIIKVALFFAFLFFLQIIIGYVFIWKISLTQTKISLNALISRIQNDLKYTNGKWDTRLYAADPYTPHPTGSSGFRSPLYIVTTEGFVIERNQPINGLLDAADFKHLLLFTTPQTIETSTNEMWRIVSRPIKNHSAVVGVIAVSYYNPIPEATEAIDAKLDATLQYLQLHIAVKTTEINISKLDIRSVPYDISFEVVNNFNKVLSNNGRTPSFIDPSYIDAEIKNIQKERKIQDQLTGELYMLESKIISVPHSNTPLAIIVTGQSLKPLYEMLNIYLLFSFLSTIVLVIPLSFITVYILKKDLNLLFPRKSKKLYVPSLISFHKKDSILHIDEHEIEIPYASNQYYLLESILSHPKKRWEQDVIAERFGDTFEGDSSRKVYDAMLAVNKKAGVKLILYKDRTYRFNSLFINQLQLL